MVPGSENRLPVKTAQEAYLGVARSVANLGPLPEPTPVDRSDLG
jgi:hypothetical protein